MDLSKVLEQLRKELAHLDAAILSLERLQAKEARRGRPPKMLAELRNASPTAQPGGRRQARRSPTAE
jgi:hypothetical protein